MSDSEMIAPEEDHGPDDQEQSFSAFAEAFRDDPEAEPAAPEEDHGPAEDAEGEAEDVPEDLRKAGQRYDSMEGRLRKEREELERKAQEYEALKAELQAAQTERRRVTEALIQARQGQQPAQQAAPAKQPLQLAEIPEAIKDEAENFAREYPELTPLLRYPGKEGEKLRKMLGEYGVDVAATHGRAVMAEYKLFQTENNVRRQFGNLEQRAVQQQREMQQRLENERRQAHYHQIYSAVPEYAQMATDPSRRSDLQAYHARLTDWVESKPHREASRMLNVLRRGDAPSVVEVLTRFQTEAANNQPARHANARRSAAMAASAMPSRATSPPRGAPDPNDTQGAFREAFG
jgi:hypothetical protein